MKTILKNIAAAMPSGGTLIIIEGALDARNGIDRLMKLHDLEQMIMTGGRVRTRSDFEFLLQGAGFRLKEIRRTSLYDASLIIATKI